MSFAENMQATIVFFGLVSILLEIASAGKANLVGYPVQAGTELDPSHLLTTRETPYKSACSLQCNFLSDCNGFELQQGQCRLYRTLIPIDSPGAPPSSYFEYDYVLLVRHNGKEGQLFPKFSGNWALNKDDLDALLYSRMDELDQFKGFDGAYNFKLCYPDLPGEAKCFIFDQTSDPRSSSAPTGFRVYETPPQFMHDCSKFKGLLSDSKHKSWMDGVVGSAAWSMSVGATYKYGSGATAGYFPSPSCRQGWTFLSGHVELFIKMK